MLPSNQKSKILLQVTGSIAAFKAVALCSKLVQLGHEVEVILTEGALKFLGAASFEGFTRKKVHRGLYTEGHMMAHIDLERWADVILLYPASANTIAKLASGHADTLITALFLAHEFKKPYFIAPAMNQAMLAHPATQGNLQILKNYGVRILTPNEGALACGEFGAGRVVEPEEILEILESTLNPEVKMNQKKILITSGGTAEPIDSVRSITNFSTGETGYRIARELELAGHDVTLIQSKSSSFQFPNQLHYHTTDEFVAVMKSQLQKNSYDYLIHAAAVADFRVNEIAPHKMQGSESHNLKLVPNEKAIKSVRHWSQNQNLKLISFKLTSNSDLKLDAYDSEWIIHNELKDVNQEQHAGTIYNKDKVPQFKFKTKTELAQRVQSIVEGLAEGSSI